MAQAPGELKEEKNMVLILLVLSAITAASSKFNF